MIVIALVFVLITLYEWANWRKHYNNTAKLWKLVTVNMVLLTLLEVHFLVKDTWNINIALLGFYRFLERMF
ncbi:hypothetical protein [Paenibacillus lentus]|uniref:Uncharacterized protein n=1 Tax=Paenibacillus lentus TaxID=1338368 RepID=A0A3S8RX55_9BACL|nr:hypothetical protein [Paenibacillus lentus]AZK47277.1 hypothetical protein EIM92_14845 [Paenibacillus lentus]